MLDSAPEGSILIDGVELANAERTPCEVWTRVMGYHRPKESFNIGKQSEFAERRYFSERPTGSAPKALAA